MTADVRRDNRTDQRARLGATVSGQRPALGPAGQAAAGFGWPTAAAPPYMFSGGDPGTDLSFGNVTFQVRPTAASCQNLTCQTGHSGGMQVAIGDGSVRTVTPSISVATWRTACNDPAYAGKGLGSDW